MSLPRFFLEEQVLAEIQTQPFELGLSADDLKHAKVRRLAVGEHIAVVDADKDYFECEIESFESDAIFVSIAKHEVVKKLLFEVTLVQGIPKADKFEMILRHATELGVSCFIPLACERSVKKIDSKKVSKTLTRWVSIVKSAAEQSGAQQIPDVFPPTKMSGLIKELKDFDQVLILWEEAEQSCYLSDALASVKEKCDLSQDNAMKIAVIVGPEGGLSQNEVDRLLSLEQSTLVSLGPTILRTETAGIVGPALVLYELGALGNSSLM